MILDILGKAESPLSLNEIAKHFSIDRSSVFRLVTTLLKSGYVIQHSETKRYSLGYKVLELSRTFSKQSYLEDVIKPIMHRVLEETHQNTHLAALDGDQVIFLMVEQPKDHLSLNITAGSREPAAVTALGRSLLAFQDDASLNRMLSTISFTRYTKKSVTSAGALKKCLRQVKKDLLAIDDEEYRPGIMCIAAPVLDHRREVHYAIGITGLKDVIKKNLPEFQASVKQAGLDASALLNAMP